MTQEDKESIWPRNCFTCKHRFNNCKYKFTVVVCDEFKFV